MTDTEIIKALECCHTKRVWDCKFCPFHYKEAEINSNCLNELTLNALDLINRQKAEIEKNENIIRIADKTIETQNAEIERLNVELDDKQFRCDSCDRIAFTSSEHRFCVKQAKAEAIKDFAERLKKKAIRLNLELSIQAVFLEDIDNLVKEMVGE